MAGLGFRLKNNLKNNLKNKNRKPKREDVVKHLLKGLIGDERGGPSAPLLCREPSVRTLKTVLAPTSKPQLGSESGIAGSSVPSCLPRRCGMTIAGHRSPICESRSQR